MTIWKIVGFIVLMSFWFAMAAPLLNRGFWKSTWFEIRHARGFFELLDVLVSTIIGLGMVCAPFVVCYWVLDDILG